MAARLPQTKDVYEMLKNLKAPVSSSWKTRKKNTTKTSEKLKDIAETRDNWITQNTIEYQNRLHQPKILDKLCFKQ